MQTLELQFTMSHYWKLFLCFVFKATGCLLPYALHSPCCPVFFLLHCFLSLVDLDEIFDIVLYIYVRRQYVSYSFTLLTATPYTSASFLTRD